MDETGKMQTHPNKEKAKMLPVQTRDLSETQAALKEEHLKLASVIKGLHKHLRREFRANDGDATKTWNNHVHDQERLKQYADAMHRLATEHWSVYPDTRIEWCKKTAVDFFKGGGLQEALAKDKKFRLRDMKKIEKMKREKSASGNYECDGVVGKTTCREKCFQTIECEAALLRDQPSIRLVDLSSNCEKIRLLDVGSCYNPFLQFENFDAVGVDLAPAIGSVLQCDFLRLKVSDTSNNFQTSKLTRSTKTLESESLTSGFDIKPAVHHENFFSPPSKSANDDIHSLSGNTASEKTSCLDTNFDHCVNQSYECWRLQNVANMKELSSATLNTDIFSTGHEKRNSPLHLKMISETPPDFFSNDAYVIEDKEQNSHTTSRNLKEQSRNGLESSKTKSEFVALNCTNVISSFSDLCEENSVNKVKMIGMPSSDPLLYNLKDLESPLVELPAGCFHVVVFSFLLEYLPSPSQRWRCCINAHRLLCSGGLLLIVTPDSKHQNRNAPMIKSWKIALESSGFLRWKYEKRDHMHCMAFRKMFDYKFENDQEEEASHKQAMMYIPQDFSDACYDDVRPEPDSEGRSEDLEEFITNTLEELPVFDNLLL